jgi:Bacterial regulatory helix-turn-helix protein, lysR family
MDDRRLRYFLTVVDEGSVTGAARRLHVAQPSLSQALRASSQRSLLSCSIESGEASGCQRRARR